MLRKDTAVAALLAVCAAASGCSPEDTPSAPLIPKVRVFEVGERATGQSRRISGRIDALEQAALSFGISGKVAQIHVVDGQTVAMGDVLGDLDPATLDLASSEAASSLTQARANLTEAESTFGRMERLLEKGGASKQEFESATASLTTARATVAASEAALQRARIDREKAQLVAPFAGRVVSVDVDEFQEVGGAETVAVLQSSEALKIEVLVPESMIGKITFGQAVQVTAPTTGDQLFPATITEIAAQTREGNAYPVTAVLAGAINDLLPGMTASVIFTYSGYLDGREAFLLPLSALAVDVLPGSPSAGPPESAPVFVLDQATSTVALRQVQVGGLRGNSIEVFEGLKAGDLVITAGVAFVREGMQAERWEPRQ